MTTHRNHGHLVARGADPGAGLAEILGRATGLNGGRGGYVLGLGPQRTLTDRLRDDFPDRVCFPPTAEAGIGAAMAGMRPFVDLGTASFSFLA